MDLGKKKWKWIEEKEVRGQKRCAAKGAAIHL